MRTNNVNQQKRSSDGILRLLRTVGLVPSLSGLRTGLIWFLTFLMLWQSAAPPEADARPKNSKSSSSKALAALQEGMVIVFGPQQVVRPPSNATYTAQFTLPSGTIPHITLH